MSSGGPIQIFTDGSCLKNPGGPGGWSAVIDDGNGKRRELSGGEPSTTCNRMELTGAIKALEAIDPDVPAIIVSDSRYVVDGITRWAPRWKARGWKRGQQPPANLDLWKRLDALAADRDVSWQWCRGHNGNAGNERADQLANRAALQHGKRTDLPANAGKLVGETDDDAAQHCERCERMSEAASEILRRVRGPGGVCVWCGAGRGKQHRDSCPCRPLILEKNGAANAPASLGHQQ